MRRLTEDSGATVLFVSHDITSVQALCTRAIWIERGQLHMEGDTLSVSKSYYASILKQEEERLRARTASAIARMRRRSSEGTSAAEEEEQILFRFITASGGEPQQAHPIRRLVLRTENGPIRELRPGEPMDNDTDQPSFLMSDRQYVTWSAPTEALGETVRAVAPTGGEYNHAPFCFKVTPGAETRSMELEIEYLPNPTEPLSVDFLDGTEYRRLGLLEAGPNAQWRVATFPVGSNDAGHVAAPSEAAETVNDTAASAEATEVDGLEQPSADEPPAQEVTDAIEQDLPVRQDKWSTAEGEFEHVETLSANGEPKIIFGCGETIVFRCGVALRTPLSSVWLCAVVYDNRGNRIILSADLLNTRVSAGRYELDLTFANPNLRQGDYVVTLELLPEFDYNWSGSGRLPFICHWDRCVYFKIDEQYHGTIDRGLLKIETKLAISAAERYAPHATKRLPKRSAVSG